MNETFTTPDGTLSFRHPTGWAVTATNDQDFGNTHQFWQLTHPDGQTTLQLGISSDTNPVGSAPLTTILPQGVVPGAQDQLGETIRVVVGASPGQMAGANGGLHYGLAADSGADTTIFNPRWGENHLLFFGGWHLLGPNDQVDVDAAAAEFASSSLFRNEILPIIQSLTVSAPPVAGDEACVGAVYTYQNLNRVNCDEAKAILQMVLDFGEPAGARSMITSEYECYESSFVEQTEGLPVLTCWYLDSQGFRDQVVLEANLR